MPEPIFFGLKGRAGAGKTTLAQLAIKHTQSIGMVASFADPIRNALSMIGVTKKGNPELYRRGAQYIGTELCRAHDEDWWVNQALKNWRGSGSRYVLFDDVRFANEASIMHGCFFVSPSGFEPYDLGANRSHTSEALALEGPKPDDIVIPNQMDQEEAAAKKIAAHITRILDQCS